MINFVASINKQWDSILSLVCYHKTFPTGPKREHPKLPTEAKNSSFCTSLINFKTNYHPLCLWRSKYLIFVRKFQQGTILRWANTSLNPLKHNICTSPVDNKNSYQNNEICEWMINADSCKKNGTSLVHVKNCYKNKKDLNKR